MAIVPIVLAERGLTGENDPYRIKTGDLTLAQNMSFGVGNLAEKEGGSAKVNAVAIAGGPILRCGFDWWATPLLQRRIVACSDGTVQRDAMTGTFASIGSGRVDAVTHMIEAGLEAAGRNRLLLLNNGSDATAVISGDAVALTGLLHAPADWTGTHQPRFMIPFRSVLIGAGNDNNPYMLYASLSTDHTDYTSAGTWSLPIYPGEGQKLVGAVTAFARLYLFKYPAGIYSLNDSASAVSGWFAQPVSRQYGSAPTPHAMAQIDEAVVAFVSNTGSVIMMQETLGSLTGVAFTDLSRVLNLRQLIRDNFELSRLQYVQMRWYDEKKQLHIVYPAKGGTLENRRLVIDFNEDRTRVEISTKDVNESLWMEIDSSSIPRPVSGDNAGFMWKMDQVNRNVNGVAYTYGLTTAPTDFSDLDPSYMGWKNLSRLHLEFQATGAFPCSIQVLVDGINKGTYSFDLSGAGSALPFDLPGILGSPTLKRIWHDIAGAGQYVSLVITESGLNTNPRLSRAWIEFDLVGPVR